jgi:RimJ/RimL family protein N-acetyltransferase
MNPEGVPLPPPQLFFLESPRLRLREFDPGDEPALCAMHADPRVRALLVDDYPLDKPLVAAYFVQRLGTVYREREGLGIWHAERWVSESGVCEGGTQSAADAWRFSGWFNLMPMPDDPSRVEIGCRLPPDAWGTGIAVEGGQMLLRHAFETLQLPAVWGICHPRHHAVHAVLGTLGFAARGVEPYDGQPAAHFEIDQAAWRAAAAEPARERRRAAVRQARRQAQAAAALAVAAA